MKKFVAAVLVVLSLTACGHETRDVPTPTLYTREPFLAPEVPPLSLDAVEITTTVLPDGSVGFVLTPESLNALQKNDKAIQNTLLKKQAVIDGYKKYYEKPLDATVKK